MSAPTAEQLARDMLERIGMPGAQSLTAGDVVELANLINEAGSRTIHVHHSGERRASPPVDLLTVLVELLAMCERQDDFNDDGDGGMFERARAAIAIATKLESAK